MSSSFIANWFIQVEIGLKIWLEGILINKDMQEKTSCWKLDSHLLKIKDVGKDIEKEIKEYFQFNSDWVVPVSIVWDAHKAVLWGKLMAISFTYKKENNN